MRNRPGRRDGETGEALLEPISASAESTPLAEPDESAERTAAAAPKVPSRIAVFGATSAIAQAWMRLLAPEGASFFLVARNAAHLASVAQDLVVRGAATVYIEPADLNDTARHPAMLDRMRTSLGELDCALIAHGALGDQSAGEQDYEAASTSLQTNFLSSVSLATWLANYFSAAHRGTLAVISSVAGDRGRKSNYIYGSAKAGLNAFLDGLRNRVDREGVQVLTIRPGFVATPMTAHLPQGRLFTTPEAVARDIQRAIRSRRDVVYTPWFWRWIMAAIRFVPEWKFKRMDL